jgi:hypothetical protein
MRSRWSFVPPFLIAPGQIEQISQEVKKNLFCINGLTFRSDPNLGRNVKGSRWHRMKRQRMPEKISGMAMSQG